MGKKDYDKKRKRKIHAPKLSGTAKLGSFDFRDQNGRKIALNDAIFGIIRGAGHDAQVVGTGFYISNTGMFVTAKHCLAEYADGPDSNGNVPYTIIHKLPGGGWIPRSIERIYGSNNHDVLVGIAKRVMPEGTTEWLKNSRIALTDKIPNPGQKIVTYAYPKSVSKASKKGVDIHTWPRCFQGKVIELHPKGRGGLIPWPTIQTDIHIHGGASGGPVFWSAKGGAAFAINTTSFSGAPDISYVTPVTLIFNFMIEDIRFEGTPKESEPQKMTIRQLADMDALKIGPPFHGADT